MSGSLTVRCGCITSLVVKSVTTTNTPDIRNMTTIKKKLANVARSLAVEKKAELDQLKAEHSQLARPDFIWHYLLQSFATMGRAAGWVGLIGNQANYNKVQYEVLAKLNPTDRVVQVDQTCRDAKIRMPSIKAGYILKCFEQVERLGGPLRAKQALLARPGRDAKIAFLKSFAGIGDKYARNIMMDVYHEDFRDSIAIDVRIKALSEQWGLSFSSYAAHEEFYLAVATDAGINGWELDRLMFNYQREFLARV